MKPCIIKPSPLLSIVIPAYDKPDLLARAINSVIQQSYRPIEIIVCDDASPSSLSIVVRQFSEQSHEGIEFVYHRNDFNISFYWNSFKALELASGDYAAFLHHDDYYIQASALHSSVAILSTTRTLAAISNSLVESSLTTMMTWLAPGWHVISGHNYLRYNLFHNAHPSFSGVVFSLPELRKCRYFESFIPKEVAVSFNCELDEAFLFLIALALKGDVVVTGDIFSVRGSPLDSFSRSQKWSKHGGSMSGFAVLYNYYRQLISDSQRKLLLRIIIKIYCSFSFVPFRYLLLARRSSFLSPQLLKLILIGILRYYAIAACRLPHAILKMASNR